MSVITSAKNKAIIYLKYVKCFIITTKEYDNMNYLGQQSTSLRILIVCLPFWRILRSSIKILFNCLF